MACSVATGELETTSFHDHREDMNLETLDPTTADSTGRSAPPDPRLGREVDLTVAIVNYRSLDLLISCLQSWDAATSGICAEISVVENGTGEPVRQALAEIVPDAQVSILPKATSFSAAVNLALRESRGRHVGLLNPDTVLRARSLTTLVSHLDQNPVVGIVGPKVWDDLEHTSIQRSWRTFPGVMTSLFTRYSLLTRLFPNNPWSRRYLNQDSPADMVHRTDWVSGCCMVIRGTLFRGIGGLDERFPLFCEDIDICRRAAGYGFDVVYEPSAEIVHFIGGSRGQDRLRSLLFRHRSMMRYVLKWNRRWNPFVWMLVLGIWVRFALLCPWVGRQI